MQEYVHINSAVLGNHVSKYKYMWNNFHNLLAHNATNHRLRFWFSLYTEQ